MSGRTALLAALADVVLGTPADGQALVYQASTQKWVAASPAVAGAEIAYAENVSGTPTNASATNGVSNGAVDIANCAISVPANSGIVMLEGYASVNQTVAGIGGASLAIVETTSGSTILETVGRALPNNATANANTVGNLVVERRVGPTTGTRTFKLTLQALAVAGNSPTVQAVNQPAFGGFRSFLRAWAM